MMQLSPAHWAKIDELDQLAKTRSDAMQVPRAEGELLAAIALAHHAKRIVEVGTSYGFSGLWWTAALSVTGGHLDTIDISEKKFTSSKVTFVEAGVAQYVTNHLGDANQVLAGMDGPIDLLFLDADKPNCRRYFDLMWPKVRVGGAVLTDNALTHQRELADFLDYLRKREETHSLTLSVGNGLEWTVKYR